MAHGCLKMRISKLKQQYQVEVDYNYLETISNQGEMRLGIDAYLTTIFVGLFISQSLDTVVHIMCSSHKFLHNRTLLHTRVIWYGLG